MKIGARIVKTGIAVTITMLICQVLALEPAFFGAVSAVINMQPSISLTLKSARDQVLVHVIGVTAGLGLGYLLGGNPVSMGVISILLIFVLIKFKLQSGISMGVVAAVFVLSSSTDQFLPHALARTAVIFVGLGTALAVNILLWPPRYGRQFKAKLAEANEATVNYFCQAITDYVNMENEAPPFDTALRDRVRKLNGEARTLAGFLRREGGLAPGAADELEGLALANHLADYNEALAERADRIYELLPARLNRRLASGAPPISEEFRAILQILASGCATITRVNAKLRLLVAEGRRAEAEEISEDYWERLTRAIEEWQHKLTGSYYLHGLIEASVTASEIKWAAREAKRLLGEGTAMPGTS